MRPALHDVNRREQPRNLEGRPPPMDLDAELGIIADALERHGIAEARTVLADDGGDFFADQNAQAWRAIVATADEHAGHVEPAIVRAKLSLLGWSDHDIDDLFRRVASTPTIVSRVSAVAGIVREHARARALITVINHARADLYMGVGDLDAWVAANGPGIEAALHDARRPVSGTSLAQVAGDRYARTMATLGTPRDPVRLGLTVLDDAISGGFAGLTLICAARNGGKSSFLANAIVRLFRDNSHGKTRDRGVLFSLEMSVEEYSDLMLAQIADIDSRKLREPEKLTPSEHGRWAAAVEFERCNRYNVAGYEGRAFKSMPRLVSTVRAEAERCKRERRRLRFVGIDHLQLLKPGRMAHGDRGFSTREEELDVIAEQLKDLSREIDAPIIALSQVNAQGDARGSRQVEAHADNVLRLKLGKPAAYSNGAREATITITKQRFGVQGEQVSAWFYPSRARFEDGE